MFTQWPFVRAAAMSLPSDQRSLRLSVSPILEPRFTYVYTCTRILVPLTAGDILHLAFSPSGFGRPEKGFRDSSKREVGALGSR